MQSVYLDNNATTALSDRVKQAMFEVYGEPLNASSSHIFGRKARAIMEEARKKVSNLVNGGNKRVIFTSSGTEANNLAIRGFKGYNLFVSAIEHPSCLKTAKECGAYTFPATTDGVVNVEAMTRLLMQFGKGRAVVSVMLANNETGIIQPMAEVSAICKKYGALLHIDAIQCVGKIKVDVEELGADLLTVSAHKFGGPKGAAALILNKDIQLEAYTTGGGQEKNFRSGTENVEVICGFGVAADIAAEDLERGASERMLSLRNRLELGLRGIAGNEVIIFGENQPRLPNTTYVTMPNVSSETQLIHFDINNIAVSAGSACSSGKIELSHVLKAMDVKDNVAATVLRVSLGKNNNEEDVDTFLGVWRSLYEKVNLKQAA